MVKYITEITSRNMVQYFFNELYNDLKLNLYAFRSLVHLWNASLYLQILDLLSYDIFWNSGLLKVYMNDIYQ